MKLKYAQATCRVICVLKFKKHSHKIMKIITTKKKKEIPKRRQNEEKKKYHKVKFQLL